MAGAAGHQHADHDGHDGDDHSGADQHGGSPAAAGLTPAEGAVVVVMAHLLGRSREPSTSSLNGPPGPDRRERHASGER
jgi:hypothetical protein